MSHLPKPGARWRVGATVAALGASLAVVAPASAATTPPTVAVVVVSEHGTQPGALIVRSGGRVERRLPLIHAAAGQVPPAAVATLRAASGVKSLTVDRAYTLSGDETAPAAPGVTPVDVRREIGADRLDPSAQGGAGIDVAIVDSGVSPVPGLTGHLIDGPDFSSEARDPAFATIDAFGHGTHMAGIVAGRDDSGLGTGVAPGSRVVNVKVADHEGATSLISLLAGIDWAVRNAHTGGRNIRVLNLAFGAPSDGAYQNDPLALAVEAAWKGGVVVVTSAGNGGAGTDSLDSPAYDPYVVAVGAQDTAGTVDKADDGVAEFSSRGTAQRSPDVIAPGVGIISLRVPGGFLDEEFPAARVGERLFRGSGTSQSAAVVSGATALILQRRPGLSPDELKAALRASADPIAGTDPRLAGPGALDVPGSATAVVAGAVQRFTIARGGAWRGRGAPGVQLAVERPTASRWSASRWSASRWSASRWSASRWSASRWSASRWSASRWSASRWSSSSWDAATP